MRNSFKSMQSFISVQIQCESNSLPMVSPSESDDDLLVSISLTRVPNPVISLKLYGSGRGSVKVDFNITGRSFLSMMLARSVISNLSPK